MSLAYNRLCHFQSDNVFQIPVTLQGKTILLYISDNFVENQRFDEKKKSTWNLTPAGTHIEAQI